MEWDDGGGVLSTIHLSSSLFLKKDMKYGKTLIFVNLVWVHENLLRQNLCRFLCLNYFILLKRMFREWKIVWE